MKTQREKQLNGEFFNPMDKEILEIQDKSRILMKQFNDTTDSNERNLIMKKWFKSMGEDCFISTDFFCDFGCHLTLGNNVYINTHCIILDTADVAIGSNTMIGSGVQICTPVHSIIPEERKLPENECGKSIIIGEDCWIGSGAIILAGVTIGDGSTIGAGSVVTKDIPPRCVACGNPCKVIKYI